MIFTCPECQTRNRGERSGSVIACRGCANPIVVPEAPAEQPDVLPRSKPSAPVADVEIADGGAITRKLWRTATWVLLVVGLAHGALYLLLTMEARAGINAIETLYSRSQLSGARRPDAAPVPGSPAYAQWRQTHDLWLKSEAYAKHRTHAGLLRTGLLASFLVQVAITGWILMRLLVKVRRPRSRGEGGGS